MEPAETLGTISIAVGISLYIIAPVLPMNTLIGFRLGYTFMSRRLWVKFNREMGVALALIGTALIVYGRLMPGMGVDRLVLTYTALAVLAYIVLFYRAKREGELEATLKPPEPGRDYKLLKPLRIKPYIPIIAVTVTITPIVAAAWYNTPIIQAIPYTTPGAMAIALIALATRIPVVLYNPWIPPRSMFNLLFEALIIAGTLEAVFLINTLQANIRGTPIIGEQVVNLGSLIAAAYILTRFTLVMLKGKGNRRNTSNLE